MITPFVIKIVKTVKNPKKVVSVNRFNFNSVKKIVYFFVVFLCVEVRVFIDFFLNKEFVNLLIILLSIVLRMNR